MAEKDLIVVGDTAIPKKNPKKKSHGFRYRSYAVQGTLEVTVVDLPLRGDEDMNEFYPTAIVIDMVSKERTRSHAVHLSEAGVRLLLQLLRVVKLSAGKKQDTNG